MMMRKKKKKKKKMKISPVTKFLSSSTETVSLNPFLKQRIGEYRNLHKKRKIAKKILMDGPFTFGGIRGSSLCFESLRLKDNQEIEK